MSRFSHLIAARRSVPPWPIDCALATACDEVVAANPDHSSVSDLLNDCATSSQWAAGLLLAARFAEKSRLSRSDPGRILVARSIVPLIPPRWISSVTPHFFDLQGESFRLLTCGDLRPSKPRDAVDDAQVTEPLSLSADLQRAAMSDSESGKLFSTEISALIESDILSRCVTASDKVSELSTRIGSLLASCGRCRSDSFTFAVLEAHLALYVKAIRKLEYTTIFGSGESKVTICPLSPLTALSFSEHLSPLTWLERRRRRDRTIDEQLHVVPHVVKGYVLYIQRKYGGGTQKQAMLRALVDVMYVSDAAGLRALKIFCQKADHADAGSLLLLNVSLLFHRVVPRLLVLLAQEGTKEADEVLQQCLEWIFSFDPNVFLINHQVLDQGTNETFGRLDRHHRRKIYTTLFPAYKAIKSRCLELGLVSSKRCAPLLRSVFEQLTSRGTDFGSTTNVEPASNDAISPSVLATPAAMQLERAQSSRVAALWRRILPRDLLLSNFGSPHGSSHFHHFIGASIGQRGRGCWASGLSSWALLCSAMYSPAVSDSLSEEKCNPRPLIWYKTFLARCFSTSANCPWVLALQMLSASIVAYPTGTQQHPQGGRLDPCSAAWRLPSLTLAAAFNNALELGNTDAPAHTLMVYFSHIGAANARPMDRLRVAWILWKCAIAQTRGVALLAAPTGPPAWKLALHALVEPASDARSPLFALHTACWWLLHNRYAAADRAALAGTEERSECLVPLPLLVHLMAAALARQFQPERAAQEVLGPHNFQPLLGTPADLQKLIGILLSLRRTIDSHIAEFGPSVSSDGSNTEYWEDGSQPISAKAITFLNSLHGSTLMLDGSKAFFLHDVAEERLLLRFRDLADPVNRRKLHVATERQLSGYLVLGIQVDATVTALQALASRSHR